MSRKGVRKTYGGKAGGRGSRRPPARRKTFKLRRNLAFLVAISILATSCGLTVVGIKNAISDGSEDQAAQVGSEGTAATTGEDSGSGIEGTTAGGESSAEGEGSGVGGPEELIAAKTCDDLDILVDPGHPLPHSYVPQDLTYLQGYGVAATATGLPLRREAAKHLGRLSEAVSSSGEEALVSSAYRSYAEQQETFAHYTGIYGDWADHVSAPPGQSQHQLGTTVDFTNSEVGYQLIPTFGDTSASRWLSRNAWRHGFVNTYPAEDTGGTGRQAEPWEYRYVGLQTAREIQKSDLSLRQFLEKNGQAPCR